MAGLVKWLFEKIALGLVCVWIIAMAATIVWGVLQPVLPFLLFVLFGGVTLGGAGAYYYRKNRYW